MGNPKSNIEPFKLLADGRTTDAIELLLKDRRFIEYRRQITLISNQWKRLEMQIILRTISPESQYIEESKIVDSLLSIVGLALPTYSHHLTTWNNPQKPNWLSIVSISTFLLSLGVLFITLNQPPIPVDFQQVSEGDTVNPDDLVDSVYYSITGYALLNNRIGPGGKNEPLASVNVTSSLGGLAVTDQNGKFKLNVKAPSKFPTINIGVKKDGYKVVNPECLSNVVLGKTTGLLAYFSDSVEFERNHARLIGPCLRALDDSLKLMLNKIGVIQATKRDRLQMNQESCDSMQLAYLMKKAKIKDFIENLLTQNLVTVSPQEAMALECAQKGDIDCLFRFAFSQESSSPNPCTL